MNKHNLISIDLAKNVFQVCGTTRHQKVVFNKQLKRSELAGFIQQQPPTVIAMEACYSSHYWARCFTAMGHEVKLLPAQHVSPFVTGNKSDHNDAVAISEAALRPNIKAVPIKTIEQQDIQALHRIRSRCIANRTGLMNQARGLLSEYGVIAPQGLKAFSQLLASMVSPESKALSQLMKRQVVKVREEYASLTDEIEELNEQLMVIAKDNEYCQILMSIPGIGVVNATAIYSAIGDGSQFKNGRELSVWLGLTPRQKSSGQSFSSGGITKRGNKYLRKQLVHGARSALARCVNKDDSLSKWACNLVDRRGHNKACVALAARMARIAWVLLNRKEMFKRK